MFLTSEIMLRLLSKRKFSTPNAINCTSIVCHSLPPFGFQNKQTNSSKYSFGANNEHSHLPSQYSTACNPTELLELQSPMTKIQSKTVFIPHFLNVVRQKSFSYDQHIMNQKLMCAKKKIEKSCLLAYKLYCDMELRQHNNLVMQYCDDEIGNKVPFNTKNPTNDYDFKKPLRQTYFWMDCKRTFNVLIIWDLITIQMDQKIFVLFLFIVALTLWTKKVLICFYAFVIVILWLPKKHLDVDTFLRKMKVWSFTIITHQMYTSSLAVPFVKICSLLCLQF